MRNTGLLLFSLLLMASPLWAAKPASVPLTIVASLYGGGQLMAPCQIDGQKADCKIDMGANASSVRKTETTDKYPSLGTSSYVSATGSRVTCDNIQIDNFQWAELPGDSAEFIRCPNVDLRTSLNIAGLDLLKKQPFRLNYANKLLEFSPAEPTQGWRTFTEDPMGHVLIPLKVGHNNSKQYPSVAMIDSGAALTVVSLEFVEKHPESFTVLQEIDQGRDTHGNKLVNKLTLVKGLIVGDRVFVGDYVMAIDFSAIQRLAGPQVEFILGHNVLKQSNWTFDLQKKIWAAE